MKDRNVRTLLAGMALGAMVTAGLGASLPAMSESFREVSFGREKAVEMRGDNLFLFATDTKPEALPTLPNKEETRTGRYQMLVREGEPGSMLVLDTQNGLVREWTDDCRVRVYNPTVPNHVVVAPVRVQTITRDGLLPN